MKVNPTKLLVRVIGMDGCSVNTGIHNGAIRLLEVKMGDVLQHVICGLHMNELVFWHILCDTDGVTKGPDSLSGPVGSTLSGDIWLEPVVAFKPIAGKVPLLPDEVIKDLSRDQQLAYRYAQAIQSGVMPDNLAGQTIGPLITSRWVTCAVRICCKYTRTGRPCKALVRLTKVALNVYFPGWFVFKQHSHIQQGSKNFFFIMELTRDSVTVDRAIAIKVLQDNSHWAHTENILISMLCDEREEIRRKAALRILKARREFDEANHPRKFVPPTVNFEVCSFSILKNKESPPFFYSFIFYLIKARNYFDMVDWETEPSTEPPLTMDLSVQEILDCIGSPLILPPYPNHTQSVERMVRVVSEVSSKRVGYVARHRYDR